MGAWWSGLSQKEEHCSHPDKVMLAFLSLSSEQAGEKHSYPVAISARQRPITTRQKGKKEVDMNEAGQVKIVIYIKGQCCHNFKQVKVVNS